MEMRVCEWAVANGVLIPPGRDGDVTTTKGLLSVQPPSILRISIHSGMKKKTGVLVIASQSKPL